MSKVRNNRKDKFHNAFKKNSLASRMWLVIFVAFLIFATVFGVSTLVITRQERRNYEINESEIFINSAASSILAGIENYKDISRLVMIDDSVTKFLKALAVDAGLKNDTKYGVYDVLYASTNMDSVFIFRNDNIYICTGRGEYDIDFLLMMSDEWYDMILSKRGGAVVTMNGNNAVFRRDKAPIVTIGRAIYDIYTQKLSGILLMNISLKMFDEIVNNQKNADMAILTDEGEFLSGDKALMKYFEPMDKGRIFHNEVKVDKERFMISKYAIPDTPLVIITSNYAEATDASRRTIAVLSLILIAFVISLFIAAVFVAKNINKPIYDLSMAMEETRKSGWMKKIDLKSPKNEIGTLINCYNRMIEYLNDLFTRLIEKEKSVQKAEMRVLQEQIKPHFLYNSLETISFMAYDAKAQNVYDALETLGSFYRNFLSKGDREITVKREINIIKDYLSLQKLRYGEIIDDQYDIEEDTLELRIPKLILQPLVENCIYHGIRPKGEKGIIRISSKISEENLVISVYDDGVGMQQDIIEKVLDDTNSEEAEQSEENSLLSSFGLKGTIERIRYYVDDKDVVKIESVLGEYTEITLTIPRIAKEV